MVRDTIQLENAVSTISQEYLLEFTSEYDIPESLHPELPGLEDLIVEFPEGKVDVNLFSLINAPNHAKVKTGTRPHAAHEVPLLTATANCVIDMEDMTGTSGSSGTPSTVEKSPLDFSNKDAPSLITESIRAEEQGQDELSQGAAPVRIPPHMRSTIRRKSLASIGIRTGTTVFALATHKIHVHTERVSDPDPLSSSRKAVVTEDSDTEKSTSFTSMVGSPGRYFSKLRHLPNDVFLNQYNTTLARQVAMGSQLRLRFEQETKLLKKAVAQVARWDKRIEAREKHIRNVEALLEAEVDMKGAAEAKNVELAKELESLRVQFSNLQDLYPHMLTAIVGRRWAIRHSLLLAVMKCAESTELRQVFVDVVSAGIAKGMSEGLRHGVEHGKAKVDLADIEAYDPNAETKYVAVLHALKDLKYSLLGQLEKLKDPTIDLKIPVYLEVRNPKDPWSFKYEILLEDAIAANVSHAEKKKKCRVMCHTHGVGSAHHTRSDGVPVSVPTISPQGLAILLADAATQTQIIENEASPRLIRSKSLPPLYDLDWP
nr:hypothetical protein [Tanacetum cinerariifolium]